MKKLFLTIAMVSGACATIYAENEVDATRNAVSEWMSTQNLIASERHTWKEDQEYLARSISLFEANLSSIQEEIDHLEGTQSSGEEERVDLLAEQKKLKQISDSLKVRLKGYEQQIIENSAIYPSPLLKVIQPLLKRIPKKENKKVSLGMRVQNIVGILSQVNKFQTTLSLEHETTKLGGKEIQVKTLYWGFAKAFSVDSKGEFAKTGHVKNGQWVWVEANEIAPKLLDLLLQYEGTGEIHFVDVPVTL